MSISVPKNRGDAFVFGYDGAVVAASALEDLCEVHCGLGRGAGEVEDVDAALGDHYGQVELGEPVMRNVSDTLGLTDPCRTVASCFEISIF